MKSLPFYLRNKIQIRLLMLMIFSVNVMPTQHVQQLWFQLLVLKICTDFLPHFLQL